MIVTAFIENEDINAICAMMLYYQLMTMTADIEGETVIRAHKGAED